MSTRHIGFDVAVRATGFAFRSAAGRWYFGVVHDLDPEALRRCIEAARANGIMAAAIEDCYCGKNVKTALALKEAQTVVRMTCERYGLTASLVPAQTWQSAFGIGGNRPERKAGARRVAQMLGAVVESQDAADAVCIAEHADRLAQTQDRSRTREGNSLRPRGSVHGDDGRPGAIRAALKKGNQ